MRQPARWLTSSPQRLTVLVGVTLLALYAGWLSYAIRADRPLDFYVYYMAGEALARGQSPYALPETEWKTLAADLGIATSTPPYRYPPYTGALLMLFRPLGPHQTMVIWVVANAVAMGAGAWLVGQALEIRPRTCDLARSMGCSPTEGAGRVPLGLGPRTDEQKISSITGWFPTITHRLGFSAKPLGGGWWVPASLTALLVFVPPLATLLAGQVNGLLFLCLALAFWALVRRRGVLLGASLALGAALKVIPLALIFYLFWRRRWRAGLAGVAILLALVMAFLPVTGWEPLGDYARIAVSLGRPDLVYARPPNQTFTAVLGRALPGTPSLALAGGRWLGALLVMATAAICWPARHSDRWMPLEFGLIVAALQLIAPFCWYHQLVLLVIPLMALVQQAWAARRWGWLGLVGALYVLTDIHGLAWHHLEGNPHLTSFPFLMTATLWVLLAWLIVRGKRRDALVRSVE